MTTLDLDSVVRLYLFKTGKKTLHGYVRCMAHLTDFIRKFSLMHVYMDARTVLKTDEKRACSFPQNFLYFTTIAFVSGDRLIRLQRDNSINLYHSYCNDVATADINESYNVFQSWPYNGSALIENALDPTLPATSLGIGHNGAGYFRINWKDREIQFSTDVPAVKEIYMEYKTTGLLPTTRSTIPEFAKNVAESYIHWQSAKYDRRLGDSSAETQARRQDFLREYDDMMAALDPIDAETIRNIQARSFDFNKIIH